MFTLGISFGLFVAKAESFKSATRFVVREAVACSPSFELLGDYFDLFGMLLPMPRR